MEKLLICTFENVYISIDKKSAKINFIGSLKLTTLYMFTNSVTIMSINNQKNGTL